MGLTLLWDRLLPKRLTHPRRDGRIAACGHARTVASSETNAGSCVAFVLTAFVARLVNDHPAWATAVAVVVFASCGVYQLTPLKTRCLKHCRSPLSLLLHYGAYRGRLRDVRAGAHHWTWPDPDAERHERPARANARNSAARAPGHSVAEAWR